MVTIHRRHWRCAAAIAVVTALASCASYDFAAARRADGTLDVDRLITDLGDHDHKSLGTLSWIPLIHFDLDVFAVAEPLLAEGYSMKQLDGYGPLFFVEGSDITHFDKAGKPYEHQRGSSVLWGLYRTSQTDVQTTQGQRREVRTELLFGLLHWDDVVYSRPVEP